MLRFIRENALIIYPVLLITSFYATWFAARYHLGHWPIASLDDPKSIKGFWMWTYSSTIFLALLGLPIAIALTAYDTFTKYQSASSNKKKSLLKIATGTSLLITTYWIIGNEPQDILQWLLD
ncbi:MAG: hypothetical protein ACSHX6_07400 [Akkermansiaceae bacterium]